MVKVNGKMVPFFANDGKGSNDLRRALSGAEVRRYAMGGEIEEKPYKYMRFGGKMAYADEGNDVPEGDPKKSKKSPYVRSKEVASVEYTSNDGMQSAQGEGKIDAYNFNGPDGGLDAMSPDEQERLKKTAFGKKYLSGSGSLDSQYQQYATKINRFISENPEKALAAADNMIASGNSNFARALDGKSDEEKLNLMSSYMTDKKIGDFHGALSFDKMDVPTARFYDPNPEVSQSGFRGASFPKVLNGVGDRMVSPGDISALASRAEEAGVDLSEENEASINFVTKFMDEFGSQERGRGYEGADNEYFMDRAKDSFEAKDALSREQANERRRGAVSPTSQSSTKSAADFANERRRRAAEQIARQKGQLYGGGVIYKRADKGVKVDPTKEERERGVTSVSRGLFNRTESFGNKGTVKYPTGFGKLFTRKDLKVNF